MRKAITKKAVEATLAAGVPDGKAYVMLWDTNPPRFGVRVRKSGGASFLYRYRPKGAPREAAMQTLTLGTWPALSVEAARKLAIAHAGRVAMGTDPAGEARQARLRSRSVVNTALNDYATTLEQRHIVKRDQVMASLRRGFAPEMNSELGKLDLRTLVGLIDRVATTKRRQKDGSAVTTPGAGAYFRKNAHNFLGWAALRGLAPGNVLAGYRLPKQSREERRVGRLRQGRALADAEIVAVWNAASEKGTFGALVQLALLTGLRRNELAELRWSEVKDDCLLIPEARTKMGREHRVPLTPLMRSVLARQERSASGLVFPSSVTGSALAGWSKLTPKLVKASGVAFRLHDLRRTCRTLMARLGVAEEIAELAIGHVRRGLVGVYDKSERSEERRDAFEKVSSHVANLLADAEGGTITINNIVPISEGEKIAMSID